VAYKDITLVPNFAKIGQLFHKLKGHTQWRSDLADPILCLTAAKKAAKLLEGTPHFGPTTFKS